MKVSSKQISFTMEMERDYHKSPILFQNDMKRQRCFGSAVLVSTVRHIQSRGNCLQNVLRTQPFDTNQTRPIEIVFGGNANPWQQFLSPKTISNRLCLGTQRAAQKEAYPSPAAAGWVGPASCRPPRWGRARCPCRSPTPSPCHGEVNAAFHASVKTQQTNSCHASNIAFNGRSEVSEADPKARDSFRKKSRHFAPAESKNFGSDQISTRTKMSFCAGNRWSALTQTCSPCARRELP